jgi:RHS repeat-associated protein
LTLASPFGARAARPDLSAALDYVENAYDADLDSVRMGVRDFDPLLGQFRTPDPKYLEAIDSCAASPVDCNLFSYARNNPLSFADPGGDEPRLIGHVYLIEGTIGGRPVHYTGSTAQELRARFSKHQWRELLEAADTRVTAWEVTGDPDVAASGRQTWRSARNEALRSVEQKVLESRRNQPGMLNKSAAATKEHATTWSERHGARLGSATVVTGGVKLSANATFLILDVYTRWYEEKTSKFVMAPYLLESEEGVFTMHRETRWFVSTDYYKDYVSGPRANQSHHISRSEARTLRDEARALWGYIDWQGDWQPGILRRSLPLMEKGDLIPY